MRREAHVALVGAGAAALWALAEPSLQRLAGTAYSDVRLLGKLVRRGPGWRVAGTALHTVNGAAFALAFDGLGLRGWRQGVLAAEAENALLWPAMALVQRIHPDCRSGEWPPLVSDRRVFAQAVLAHALFGALLGAGLALLRPRE